MRCHSLQFCNSNYVRPVLLGSVLLWNWPENALKMPWKCSNAQCQQIDWINDSNRLHLKIGIWKGHGFKRLTLLFFYLWHRGWNCDCCRRFQDAPRYLDADVDILQSFHSAKHGRNGQHFMAYFTVFCRRFYDADFCHSGPIACHWSPFWAVQSSIRDFVVCIVGTFCALRLRSRRCERRCMFSHGTSKASPPFH